MIRSFFEYYKPHKILFFLDFSSSVLLGIFELAFPIAVIWFLDNLLPTGDWPLIILIAVGLFGVYCFNAFLLYVVNYWGHVLGILIETEMRRKCFEHLQKLSFSFYDSQKTGHLLARSTKDLEQIGELAHHGPEDVFTALMTFFGAFILMLYTNVQLAMLLFCVVPVIVWTTARFGNKLKSTWLQILAKIGVFNERIEDNIGGMRVVQSFANESHEKASFAKDNIHYKDLKLDAYRHIGISASVFYASTRIVQLIVLLFGSYLVIEGNLTHGEFVGFLLLVGVFIRPVEKISSVLESYTNGIAGFIRYKNLLDIQPDIIDQPDAKDLVDIRNSIIYDNVNFTYDGNSDISDGNSDILQNINLELEIGKTTAFVGPSGAGKTTICSLLPRFYEATSGTISIDGVDIQKLTLASLRKKVGVVSQDTFLFGGTIGENIAYGKLDATKAEIMQAVEKARLSDVIAKLENGLDTVVGERGVKLSGGQKQRVAIARIFLKNPNILILDEATSALDSVTEAEIQKSLLELSSGRTTLIIAHRLATISHADKIIVVDNSKIVEMGNHAELLANQSAYSRLYGAQNFG